MAEVRLGLERSEEPRDNKIMIADVLICGVCDSGKTTLLSQLISGKVVQTYTSMTHNKMTFPVENKDSVELVDVPGHERVRGQILDTFSGSTRALVFMVDSNTVSKQIRDVAECLHSILSQKIISKNRFVVLSVLQDLRPDLQIFPGLPSSSSATSRTRTWPRVPRLSRTSWRRRSRRFG